MYLYLFLFSDENLDPDLNCSYSDLKNKFRIKGFQIILQRVDVALHFADAKAVSVRIK